LLKNILIVGVESQTIHSFKAMSNFETAFQDDGAVTIIQRTLQTIGLYYRFFALIYLNLTLSLLNNILIVSAESQTIHSFKAMSNFETAFQDDGAVIINQRTL